MTVWSLLRATNWRTTRYALVRCVARFASILKSILAYNITDRLLDQRAHLSVVSNILRRFRHLVQTVTLGLILVSALIGALITELQFLLCQLLSHLGN